jgi:hypothetical protein
MIYLYTLILASHNSYHWELSCSDFNQIRNEVILDEGLSMGDRMSVLGYLESKTKEDCKETNA